MLVFNLLSFLLIILINAMIVCSYYQSKINDRSFILYAGFNKKLSTSSSSSISSKISSDSLVEGQCGCFSGLLYNDCCGALHNKIKSNNIMPKDLLKARYTAYKLSISDYIIDTSHPLSEDYVKYIVEAQASLKSGRKRWEREILSLAKENPLEYLHFKILKETIDSDTRQVITFEAIFKESDNEVLAVEEDAEFLFSKEKNCWLFKDGITRDMDMEKTKQILDALGLEFDIETESIIDGTIDEKSNTNTNSNNNDRFIAPVLTSKGKLGVFNKNKKNYIPKGTSSS